MATFADREPGNLQPVCQNCTTSTTPLWRRDEVGSVLCNACGLFLKLHGTPRPISLKTDVIKSRNRVKTAGQGQKRKVRRSWCMWGFANPCSSHYSIIMACPHLNLRVLLLQIMPTISECPTILDPIARILRSHATKLLLILPTSLLNISLTVSRQRSMHFNLPQYLRSSCVNPRQARRLRSTIAI